MNFIKSAHFFVGRGFTLIELLIVIAVLGVLTAVVLVAINPLEQLARGRDASRKSTIAQLGKSVQAYYTSQTAYPVADNTWITTLVNAGEIKTAPSNPMPTGYSAGCAVGVAIQGNFCYKTGTVGSAPEAVIYAFTEATSDKTKAKCGVAPYTQPYFVWSSNDGRAGLVCGEPGPGTQTFKD